MATGTDSRAAILRRHVAREFSRNSLGQGHRQEPAALSSRPQQERFAANATYLVICRVGAFHSRAGRPGVGAVAATSAEKRRCALSSFSTFRYLCSRPITRRIG